MSAHPQNKSWKNLDTEEKQGMVKVTMIPKREGKKTQTENIMNLCE
jgi:hypothetical protein